MTVPNEAGVAAAAPASDFSEIERLLSGARDSLTDDIVTRMSGTVAGGLDLLDRVNRSGITRALPTITRMVENGDLERLVGFVRLVAALEDSLSDDIVNRLATVATELAALVDKLARTPGFLRLIDVLAREEVQCGLIDLAESACAAKAEAGRLPATGGGVLATLRLAADPNTQSALRFVSLLANQMRKRQGGAG
jgi:hypothetical protein